MRAIHSVGKNWERLLMESNFKALLCFLLLCGCQPYKPMAHQGSAARGSSSVSSEGGSDKPVTPTEKPTELILDADKLKANPGAYKAVIRFNKSTSEQEFTPVNADVRFQLLGFPANEPGIMTVEIFQGGKLKFVAKRANTKLAYAEANRIVVDSCLILPAPWNGSQHDGSCEWDVADK
jgi:hypothetical protein